MTIKVWTNQGLMPVTARSPYYFNAREQLIAIGAETTTWHDYVILKCANGDKLFIRIKNDRLLVESIDRFLLRTRSIDKVKQLM